MVAGVLSSFAFGAGLDKIDKSLNISGLSRPKGLPKTTNHFDDVDLSTPHAKPSADVETVKSNKLFKDTNKYADDITTNGGTHKYDLETNPIKDYDINTTKNYVNKSSQVDILKSNSHIDDIDWNDSNTRFNMPATETAGCVDDLSSPKKSPSTRSNVSYIDNGVNNGISGTVNTLTNAQKSRLNALDNTIRHNLKETDFSGTLRDLQGDPVPNPQGGYYDHLTEMKQSYVSLTKIKKGLEGSLKNPNLSSTSSS